MPFDGQVDHREVRFGVGTAPSGWGGGACGYKHYCFDLQTMQVASLESSKANGKIPLASLPHITFAEQLLHLYLVDHLWLLTSLALHSFIYQTFSASTTLILKSES